MDIAKSIALGTGAIVLALAALLGPAAAQVANVTHPAYANVSDTATSIPVGHAEFCKLRPAECGANALMVPATGLDEARWAELVSVNAAVNASIVAVTDKQLYQVEEFWTYPNGYGDCEDFALEKRRQLIARGWEPSTLLLTVVRQANGEGHAVLLVRTDRGDLVLDNREGSIQLWTDTPYQFIKRQSQAHAGQWVDFLDQRAILVAARN